MPSQRFTPMKTLEVRILAPLRRSRGGDFPTDMCIDESGDVAVTNAPAGWPGSVSVDAPDEVTPFEMITKGINTPAACAIDAPEILWVTNFGAGNVTEYLKGAKKPHTVIASSALQRPPSTQSAATAVRSLSSEAGGDSGGHQRWTAHCRNATVTEVENEGKTVDASDGGSYEVSDQGIMRFEVQSWSTGEPWTLMRCSRISDCPRPNAAWPSAGGPLGWG